MPDKMYYHENKWNDAMVQDDKAVARLMLSDNNRQAKAAFECAKTDMSICELGIRFPVADRALSSVDGGRFSGSESSATFRNAMQYLGRYFRIFG